MSASVNQIFVGKFIVQFRILAYILSQPILFKKHKISITVNFKLKHRFDKM